MPRSQDDFGNGIPKPEGPHPSLVKVAKSYMFEQEIQLCLKATGSTESREAVNRVHGINHIDAVRKALNMPHQTFNTAAVYYHRFRLSHAENTYDYRDAALAAIFTACKIEDTLKKSKEVCCAAYNMKISNPSDYATQDDPMFEQPSRVVVGLERLMLESSGFAFRVRHPQRMLLKLCKASSFSRDPVSTTSWDMVSDMHRTFAPLKQSSSTMALAALELAARLQGADAAPLQHDAQGPVNYEFLATSRPEIMETMLDLLDLYTHHRALTAVGLRHTLEEFISVRIALNQEAGKEQLPRYLTPGDIDRIEHREKALGETKGSSAGTVTGGVSDGASGGGGGGARSDRETRDGGVRVSTVTDATGRKVTTREASPQSPTAAAGGGGGGGPNGSIGDRSRDGTVRFVFDPERAKDEKAAVKSFFRVEEVEEYVEVR